MGLVFLQEGVIPATKTVQEQQIIFGKTLRRRMCGYRFRKAPKGCDPGPKRRPDVAENVRGAHSDIVQFLGL